MADDDPLLDARARVVHDLTARGVDHARLVDIVDEVVAERRWWVEQWPDGAAFVAGQIAQDVQERIRDAGLARWPRCASCDQLDGHELRITPELGPDPMWVCETSGIVVAPLGSLRSRP